MPKPITEEKKIEWETKIRQQRESGLSIRQYVLKKSWQSQKIFSLMDLEPLFDTFFARWPLGLPVVS